jgi:ABC-type dipeptide/oligopeptide/nickel transport system permease component
MARYLALRTMRALATVVGVVLLVFALVRALPGDPARLILGDTATEADLHAMRARLHLDAGLPEQLGLYAGDVLDGSLGRSFRSPDETVASHIGEVFPDTLVLALVSIVLAWCFAIPLGVMAALSRGRAPDRVARVVALSGVALPTIWLGPLLVLLFAVELRVLPMPGDDEGGPLSLVLPSITIGAALAAALTRQTRGAMIESLAEPYVTASRARGLSRWRAAIAHGLRNALVPVVTVSASQLGALLGGAVVAEKIFERRGLGSLMLDAFAARDIPVLQGTVLVVALLYVSVQLLLDLALAGLDPRVRLR